MKLSTSNLTKIYTLYSNLTKIYTLYVLLSSRFAHVFFVIGLLNGPKRIIFVRLSRVISFSQMGQYPHWYIISSSYGSRSFVWHNLMIGHHKLWIYFATDTHLKQTSVLVWHVNVSHICGNYTFSLSGSINYLLGGLWFCVTITLSHWNWLIYQMLAFRNWDVTLGGNFKQQYFATKKDKSFKMFS